MNNITLERQIREIVRGAIDRWEQLAECHGLDHCPYICFYNTQFDKPYADGELNEVRWSIDNTAVTVLSPCGHEEPNVAWEDQLVTSIRTGTYMSYEDLYCLMLSCQLAGSSVDDCLDFLLGHEMGHIVHYRRTLIGKTIRAWNESAEGCLREEASMPKLRKNASYRSREAWYKRYMLQPSEAAANAAAGFTWDQIMAYWYWTAGTR